MDATNGTRARGGVAGGRLGGRVARRSTALVVALAALGAAPVASAHGGSHGPPLPPWLALAILAVGVAVVAASASARRSLSPSLALVGVFDGVALVAVGTVGLVQLSEVEALAASQPPIGQAWYGAPTLGVGLVAVVGSLVVGRIRWPERPRYAMLGMALGTWIAYPVFVPRALTNPLGYLLAAATPAVVGYVIWADAGRPLARALADRAARWFGLGVGLATALVFAFSMRLLSLVADGSGAQSDFVTATRIAKPLVYWPAVEFHVHDLVGGVPVSGVLSVGLALVVGLVAALVGLNAALLAARWRAGGIEGRADAALAAPLACCFFAPVLAVVTAVAVGSAAPLYWVFVDLASALGGLFFAASVALLTGTLVRAGVRSEV